MLQRLNRMLMVEVQSAILAPIELIPFIRIPLENITQHGYSNVNFGPLYLFCI